MGSPDGFLVLLHVQQHGVSVGEKSVQAAKVAEREASEDKDPGGPPEGVTPEIVLTQRFVVESVAVNASLLGILSHLVKFGTSCAQYLKSPDSNKANTLEHC
ncbi:hypothetical protein E2C01_009703 [Portunus trituberculatus]|uniref:Uncharacterized protein n=1 Tax=Portunus trituberculatus TaxID=210409 RepID=A0A5B7D6H0_PORTR|nr:hypothetical protein [Portunus trituberculatus]